MKALRDFALAFLKGFCKGVGFTARTLYGIVKFAVKSIAFVISAVRK